MRRMPTASFRWREYKSKSPLRARNQIDPSIVTLEMRIMVKQIESWRRGMPKTTKDAMLGDLRPGLFMRRREFTNHSAATDWDEAPLGERDAIRSPEMLLQS